MSEKDWRQPWLESLREPKPDPMELKESKRRGGKAQAALELLKRGPATTFDLMRVGGVRFGARLLELRDGTHDGTMHNITTENRGDHAVYRLRKVESR